MTDSTSEIWVCANCRSVNKIRARQCYNCRTPKDRGAVDPSTMEVTGHGRVRDIELPPFASSRERAILASVLVLAVAALQVVSVLIASGFVLGVLDGAEITEQDLRVSTTIGLVSILIALLALVAWAAWLSRVVTEMPALGLGYPAATGLTAFVENFLPGFNLLRVPAIVRDVVRRLDPNPGRGDALISAAWIGLIGGYLVPRVGAFLNVFGAESVEQALRNALILEGLATGLVVVGAIFLVVLIWWIEARIAQRRAAQLAEGGGGGGEAAGSVVADGPLRATGMAGEMAAELAADLASKHAPAPATVAGPLGSMAVNRPLDPEPIARARVANGPRLHLHVESGTSMIATLDDEAEPITLEELRAAAPALARADGSATITTSGTTYEARAMAQRAHRILSDTGVPSDLVG